MTNLEIIVAEAVANKLYTIEEVEAIFETGNTLPLHTFAVWKSMGYIVKRGEHAKIATRLWKFKKGAKETEESVDGEHSDKYFLCKAYLFTAEQVEKIA